MVADELTWDLVTEFIHFEYPKSSPGYYPRGLLGFEDVWRKSHGITVKLWYCGDVRTGRAECANLEEEHPFVTHFGMLPWMDGEGLSAQLRGYHVKVIRAVRPRRYCPGCPLKWEQILGQAVPCLWALFMRPIEGGEGFYRVFGQNVVRRGGRVLIPNATFFFDDPRHRQWDTPTKGAFWLNRGYDVLTDEETFQIEHKMRPLLYTVDYELLDDL